MCVSVAISVISSISEESPSNNDHKYVPLGYHRGTVLTCLTFSVSSLIIPHVHHWGTVLACLTFIVSSLIILSTNTSEGIQQLMLHAHGSPAAMNSSQFQPH